MIQSYTACIQDEPALIKHLLPVPSILAGIRAHYWQSPGPESLKQAFAGGLSEQELRTLRHGLFEVMEVIMKASVVQNTGLHPDEVQVQIALSIHLSLAYSLKLGNAVFVERTTLIGLCGHVMSLSNEHTDVHISN